MLSVKLSGDKVQKTETHLVLCNLKEAYLKFTETRPDIAISSSEFSELTKVEYSSWCSWYTLHVCTVHQNMKLMMQVIVHLYNQIPVQCVRYYVAESSH
jgi:hypothetical protein